MKLKFPGVGLAPKKLLRYEDFTIKQLPSGDFVVISASASYPAVLTSTGPQEWSVELQVEPLFPPFNIIDLLQRHQP